jgi:hypothetical protein
MLEGLSWRFVEVTTPKTLQRSKSARANIE